MEKYSTTVIRSEKWSTIKGPNGHCAVEPKNIQGIENECVIYVTNTGESETSPLDVVTRARNGLIIVINCDKDIRGGISGRWKKVIVGIVNQSTGQHSDDNIAKIVLAKTNEQTLESGIELDEDLEKIRKFLYERGFTIKIWQRLYWRLVEYYGTALLKVGILTPGGKFDRCLQWIDEKVLLKSTINRIST